MNKEKEFDLRFRFILDNKIDSKENYESIKRFYSQGLQVHQSME
jgi:hypothetical protein